MASSTPAKATPDPVARTKSVRGASPLSARGSVRRPGQAPRSESYGGSEEAKAETTALIEDLKEQLRKAENASEDYQRHAAVLQSKLDEALGDHDRLQETSQEYLNRVEGLEREKQEGARKYRDLESAFENDKVASMKAQEAASAREQELTDTVQRLKETMASRDKRGSMDGETLLSRATSIRGRSTPTSGHESPDIAPRDSSQNNSKLILQKDKIIESLRLELAEAQIKAVELENAGGGKNRELEKMLLEARVSNAKLLEDNESYQVLLQERTLNGSFGKSALLDPQDGSSQIPQTPNTPLLKPVSGSLADELTADTTDDNVDEKTRKLEVDLNAQKDQNKALTLYINKIITRLLQNETFEQLFESGTVTGENPLTPHPEPTPASPPQKAEDVNLESARKEAAEQANATGGFLARAGSLFGGRQRGRPKSLQPPTNTSSPEPKQPTSTAPTMTMSPPQPKQPTPTAPTMPMSPPQPDHPPSSIHLAIPTENPDSAPSIPLRRSASGRGHTRVPSMRSHRRATSEWSGAAAGIVNNMHRTHSGGIGLQSPMGLASPRQTSGPIFPSQAPPPLILEDSERGLEVDGSSRGDVASDSGYGESVMSKAASEDATPSSPRSVAAAALEGKPLPSIPTLSRSDTSQSNENKQTSAGSSWFSGAASKSADVKGGMRPLRLVQEKAEADAEKKKANRTSFMGWFQKGGQEGGVGAVRGASPPQHGGMLTSPPPHFGGHGHGRSASSVSNLGAAFTERPSSGDGEERSANG